MSTKPTAKANWTYSDPDFAIDTIEPTSGKKITGFLKLEKPKRQLLNWLFWIFSQWVDFLDNPESLVPTATFGTSPWTFNPLLSPVLLVDSSGGAVTVTLPAVSAYKGREFLVVKVSSDNNLVTVNRAGADTFNLTASTSVSFSDPLGFMRLTNDAISKWYSKIQSNNNVIETLTSGAVRQLTAEDAGKTFLLDTTGVAQITLNAPTAVIAGFRVRVIDVGGNLSAIKAVFNRTTGSLINGVAASYDLEADYGSWDISSNGTNYFVN